MSEIPASHADLLDAKAFANLASLGPDGEPQSHVLWFAWEDDHLKLSTTTSRQKYRNVERDRRVSLLILDPDNPYRYLELRGEVTEITPDPDKAFIDQLAGKYLGADEYPYKQPDAERIIMHVQPQHAVTFG